ncbi:MAG: response regulator [Halieaceae bacterium]|nr:response regulator [Halieaceae bacterium]
MTPANHYRLLVVDDDEAVLEILEECFEDEGYGVATAQSGREAVNVIAKGHIDLVLSDVRMPNGDGYFLLESIRHEDPAIPFIFMTGFSDRTAEEALRLGANAYFEKPVQLDKLLETIEEQLNQAYRR